MVCFTTGNFTAEPGILRGEKGGGTEEGGSSEGGPAPGQGGPP